MSCSDCDDPASPSARGRRLVHAGTSCPVTTGTLVRHDEQVDEQPAEVQPRNGWGIAVAVAVVGLVGAALAFEPALADLGLPSFVDRFGALRLGAALGFGLTGAALVATLPRHRLGWLMTGIGVAQALSMFVEAYGLLALHDNDAGLNGGSWGIALAAALWAPAYLAVPTLFLLLF